MPNEDSEWVEGEIRLNIAGRPLELKMTVPARPTTVRRMLPVFQQMSGAFVGLSAAEVADSGKEISCKSGCGACCRQAVPLAEAEAFAIAELVSSMPDDRRVAIEERFEYARAHFEKIGWFERLLAAGGHSPEERNEIVIEYFREGIPCPFLEDESCSIYEDRPLACREYLVTSPPENCSTLKGSDVEMVPLLVKPSSTMRATARSRNLGAVVNFVPLVRALEWAEVHEEDATEKTGEEWMAEFFRNLTRNEIPGFGGTPSA